MKFKTLKDLTTDWIDRIKRRRHTVEADELKAEAIKWVKEKNLPPFGTFCEFFNITDEDLQSI